MSARVAVISPPVVLSSTQKSRFDAATEERRNRCDLVEVVKMFYGHIRVLFTLDGNDKGYMAIVRKFVNQDLTRILGNIFPQIESLTDGTV